MAFHPPYAPSSGVQRGDLAPNQQPSRTVTTSYDYTHPSALSSHHAGLNHTRGQQHSFAAPKLPPPRVLPVNNAHHHMHHESTSALAVLPEPYRLTSRDGRFEGYGDRQAFHSEGSRLSAEQHSRTSHLDYSDEPAMFYAQPPPPSAYCRPSESSPVDMRRQSFGRDPSGRLEAANRFFDTADRSRGEADFHAHQRIASSSIAPSHEARFDPSPPRSDHVQTHHSHPDPRRHSQQRRRPSAHDFALEPVNVEHRPQSPRKRPLPFEQQACPEFQPYSGQSRAYTSSGKAPHHAHEFRPPQPRPSISAATPVSRLDERPPTERDAASVQPTVRLPLASQDGVTSSHRRPSVVAGSVGFDAHPVDLTTSTQHPFQPNRKRLRISRACDECRRRKTRCDIVGAYPGEPGHPLTISGAVPPLEPNVEPKGEMLILQPCMNCRRSEILCSYSKRPLKRGPSKGYIKDLERRLNSLESQFVAGERADGEMEENGHGSAFAPVSSTPAGKPKVRTEDRISRLESVFARPSTAKSEESSSASDESSRRNSEEDKALIKTETPSQVDLLISIPEGVANKIASTAIDSDVTALAPALSSETVATRTTDTAASSVSAEESFPTISVQSAQKSTVSRNKGKSKGKGKTGRRLATNSPLRPPDDTSAEVKSQIVSSCLHATFPIVSMRPDGESSRASSIAHLEDRVLARGLRLLAEPVEMLSAQQESQSSKSRAHAARVASLIGQASAGLGGPRDELMQQALAGAEGLRAIRKVAHRLSGQEADLLMLCHLDHLRNGRNNNSALAAAVSKLGSGSHEQNDRETYRRRTLLFMLDRWHAIAFGTPHLLMGRFGMERHSFRSMKEALGDVSQSALGDAVHEVLRCAIMLGQLNDLVQNNGGWKAISKSDVDAVIHSAMDDNERPTMVDPSDHIGTEAVSTSATNVDDSSKLLSTEALRYSLESLVRCYHALHTLPIAKNATMDDLHRIFNLAEAVLVLGTAKTPVSLQGKLIRSAIGPHVLAVAGVAFSWCLRIICMMIASSSSTDLGINRPAADTPSTDKDTTTVLVSTTWLPLEFYRRKILDYVRMCGPFCLFSGGPPASPASFAPVFLRLALYFNSTVSLASQLGSLVSPQSKTASPVHQDAIALGNEADNVLDMAREMGFLGYILAGTSQGEAWKLLTGGA